MRKQPALLSAIGFTFVLLAILGISLRAEAAPTTEVPQAQPLAPNDNSYQALPFSQNWTITTLITTTDDWSGVPGIIGYRGDNLTAASDTDPQTILADGSSTPVDVNANRSDPDSFGTGGVTEFDGVGNPVVALSGSGTADAPFILLHLNTTNLQSIVVSYNLRDIDNSVDNAVQQVALHYRIGTSGSFTNLPAGYVADATAGPTATLTTPVTVTLPVSAENQSQVQLRIMTTNATGNDEWVGIDDISVTGTPLIFEADLDLAKSGPGTASAGDPIEYTIDISNTGNITATSTLVTDTLPPEVTFVTYTTNLPVNFLLLDAQTLIWDLGDVAAGASGLITVQGTISTGLSSGTLFTNTVMASTTATETITTNNTAEWGTLIGAPDLVVVKAGPASVTAGDLVAYTLTYTNVGNLAITGVVLVDQLPAALTYVTDSLGTGMQVGNTITWTLGNLAVNASGSVVLTATTNTAGEQVNVAAISSASPESDILNNVSAFTTTVLGGDPFVIKTGPTVVFGGEIISYTIVYGNHGNVAAEVTLTDTLPISFTTADIAFDDGPPNRIDTTNTRSWTATLAADDRFTFTLALTVPTDIATNTRITNTIEIATTSLGNDPSDDLSSASSTVYQIVPISTARAGSIGQLFAVEGRVTYVPGTYNPTGWAMQDSSGGIAAFYTPVPSVTLGDRVRLVATRSINRGEEQFSTPVLYFQNLGGGPEVTPMPFTTGQIASGNTQGWLAVITGTISGLGACTNNYQFNVDDSSGPAVVFVDVDTTVNVCTLGAVNGGPISVIGYSTEFTATTPPTVTYEVKPRRSADVKLLYQVNFVYHDLENVVLPGEDVQLRGDFTSWAANPITMTHDAGYTVFTATVTFPITGVQNYRYFVPSGGASGDEWLNSNNRTLQVSSNLLQKDDYRTVFPDAAALQGPAAVTVNLGQATPAISATLLITGVTDFDSNMGRGLKGEIGYGTNVDPSLWTWSPLIFGGKSGGSDVYSAVLTPTASGVYSYAVRFNANRGAGNPGALDWVYTDLDGIPFTLAKTGVLTVTAPQLAIYKSVATAHDPAELGDVVTYTLTLSNTGDGVATNVLITDVLPSALNFGGFVQQNGATFASDAITWSGSLNASAAATIVFTATVKNDQTLYGTDVLNTVQFTSGNNGSGSAYIAFAVVKRYFTYLPLIKR
jgi:uncharacterized repeat protein (TIGR01451 family)